MPRPGRPACRAPTPPRFTALQSLTLQSRRISAPEERLEYPRQGAEGPGDDREDRVQQVTDHEDTRVSGSRGRRHLRTHWGRGEIRPQPQSRHSIDRLAVVRRVEDDLTNLQRRREFARFALRRYRRDAADEPDEVSSGDRARLQRPT